VTEHSQNLINTKLRVRKGRSDSRRGLLTSYVCKKTFKETGKISRSRQKTEQKNYFKHLTSGVDQHMIENPQMDYIIYFLF
jgi:hypothetical protein